ncbi:protein KRI1 homolog [Plodia interpunctella]|uniref:protein KRI1 homolog n=1 Tax=Plodia interpunctella TaxID=58824 RepID=UPI0023674F93|nr:protein KRI1 homolog [Plodia interpunctella]
MSKKKLFDEDSDEEIDLKTENEYAKKYDAWREKEEMHKLEQKYGSKALNSDASLSTDSEDESDEPLEVSEETEKQFLKTLALLKTKDPRIYDSSYKFFDENKEKQPEKESKAKTLTFDDSDGDDDDDGNIFSIEKKAEVDDDNAKKENKKEGKLKEFLTGEAEHIDDEVEKDLEPLKALWSDPKLSEGEAFLRDYILNKKYLDDDDMAPVTDKLLDDDDLEADEKMVEEQGKFERAYNFRFEEPDEEYLKRFPRTMNSIRPKDDRRARKRAELRARKEEEKKRKMEEIARLKALKLKEIQEKIAKIKEVTGNDELAFKEEDIEGDFDPSEHDRRMRAIFDERYYGAGAAERQKPVFPDLDEQLEIENWDNFDPEKETRNDEEGPHCEEEDFNMDADYDPKQARTNLMEEIQKSLGKKRRNRKKKSKLGQLLTIDKPKFVPTVADKTYDEYMEEYYKMDCEDVIGGDLPTRFKYREVVPNDYGLTIEEILLADDKELTQWVPLKKIVRHRPDNMERGDVKTYAQRACDVNLKKKVLPSLFKDLPEEPEIVIPIEEATKKKKKKKKNSKQSTEETNDDLADDKDNNRQNTEDGGRKNQKNIPENTDSDLEKSNVAEENNKEDSPNDIQLDKLKKKKKHKQISSNVSVIASVNDSRDGTLSKKKHKKASHVIDNYESENNAVDIGVTSGLGNSRDNSEVLESVKEKKKHKKQDVEIEIGTKVAEENDVHETKLNTNSCESSKRKRKKKTQGFVIENVNNVGPSQANLETSNSKSKNTNETNSQNNLKRKFDSITNLEPRKKKKKNNQFDKNNVGNKFKNDKFKKNNNKNEGDSGNPLAKLSDERLKAYGLNPKKYRGFLKYKKF